MELDQKGKGRKLAWTLLFCGVKQTVKHTAYEFVHLLQVCQVGHCWLEKHSKIHWVGEYNAWTLLFESPEQLRWGCTVLPFKCASTSLMWKDLYRFRRGSKSGRFKRAMTSLSSSTVHLNFSYQVLTKDITKQAGINQDNLWSWACRYRRNSEGVNISAWSASSDGRKPASIASATDMERADPCAGLGNCDSRVARSLKPLFSCFSNCCRNLLMACSIASWSGLAFMFSSSCGSGAECGGSCAGGGSGMSRRASRKPAYTMISLFILGYHRFWSNL